ncbi:MAG: hypothetical protein U0667_14585 [Chloroflexota bacterium]
MAPVTIGSFLVESYSPDPTAQADRLAHLLDRVAGGTGTSVTYRGSIAVPGDEVAMHLFEGPDALVVGAVCREAGVTPDRIVPIVASVR